MNADPQTWLYPLLYKSFVLLTADLYRLKLAGLVTKTAKAIGCSYSAYTYIYSTSRTCLVFILIAVIILFEYIQYLRLFVGNSLTQ